MTFDENSIGTDVLMLLLMDGGHWYHAFCVWLSLSLIGDFRPKSWEILGICHRWQETLQVRPVHIPV